MAFFELLALGAIAGFTIYLGLPIARMKDVSPKLKGMLNAAAAGVLFFLLVDIMGSAFETAGKHILGALLGTAPAQVAVLYATLLVGGVSAGLLGVVWFEGRYISSKENEHEGLSENRARRIATMIAVGIGMHNFSEGLAIGQSYTSGEISLALLLVVGFGLHNATEGFGIAAPLSGFRPSWRFLAFLGIVGGGPTFLGSLIGSLWVSEPLSLFFLALAAGAIIYVVKELLYHGRIYGEDLGSMGFLVLGFFLGFGTDLVIKFASGG
ncbi:MAG: ZIP family metal transporter [Candidatus Micrarchaeota archaeon]